MNEPMKQVILFLLVLLSLLPGGCQAGEKGKAAQPGESIALPQPALDGKLSLEKAFLSRRSVRDFKDQALTLSQFSQLLWAAQGITDPQGFRTAPSAGALYPLEVYAVVGKVEGLPAGVYKYQPRGHQVVRVLSGDRRKEVARAALDQEALKQGAVVLIFSGIYERTSWKYAERAERYVGIEVGHAAQNVLLQAAALGLGAVPMGAFQDDEIKKVALLQEDERPLLLIPVGVP
jgi:SagB-type dehydrogenase family enzyme